MKFPTLQTVVSFLFRKPMNISSINGSIIINGKQYKGRDVSITNGRIVIDGKDIEAAPGIGPISVTVAGDCGEVSNGSGDVFVNGSVKGSIKTGSGDVRCGAVGGSIQTGSGNIECGSVAGDVMSASGDISS